MLVIVNILLVLDSSFSIYDFCSKKYQKKKKKLKAKNYKESYLLKIMSFI